MNGKKAKKLRRMALDIAGQKDFKSPLYSGVKVKDKKVKVKAGDTIMGRIAFKDEEIIIPGITIVRERARQMYQRLKRSWSRGGESIENIGGVADVKVNF